MNRLTSIGYRVKGKSILFSLNPFTIAKNKLRYAPDLININNTIPVNKPQKNFMVDLCLPPEITQPEENAIRPKINIHVNGKLRMESSIPDVTEKTRSTANTQKIAHPR
ncbi:MAG: hypothetical protein RQ728_02950 [Brevefilum sp.]|nr:hypothetical protein [Brevefilum sp.]